MKIIFAILYKLFSPLILWMALLFFMTVLHPTILDKAVKILNLPNEQSGIEAAIIFMELIPLFLIAKALPDTWKDGEGIQAISLKEVGLLILVAIGLVIFSEMIRGLVQERLYTKMSHPFTLPDLVGEEVTLQNMMQFSNGRTFLITVLLDPILEEMVFRYFMNLPYRSRGWRIFGFFVSTFFFAITHGYEASRVVATLISGAGFYFFYKATKNLSMSIALHMAFNLMATVFLALSIKFPLFNAYKKGGKIAYSSLTAPVAIQIIFILLGLVAGYHFLKWYGKRTPLSTGNP